LTPPDGTPEDSRNTTPPKQGQINPTTEAASPLGWFEPPNWEEESNNDLDLSSAGAELLPGGLLFQAGKDGRGYLIEEASMHSVYSHEVCAGHGSFGGDAYASGVIYIACTNGTQALAYDEAARTFTPLWQGPEDAFGPPIVSGGLVWVVASGGFSGGGEALYGLDPSTGVPRYTETLPSPVADHFASPSAAGGRLFVSTGESVTAYQIAQLAPSATTSAGAGTTAAPESGEEASNVPTLLHKHLRANVHGRVRVDLRCPAAAGKCTGTVTLIAEIATIVHRGRRHTQRVVSITLAHARFGLASGDFAVSILLGKSAERRLRRHRDRLNLQVVIASPGGKSRRVAAVLTQAR
jgi:hypothetical protein